MPGTWLLLNKRESIDLVYQHSLEVDTIGYVRGVLYIKDLLFPFCRSHFSGTRMGRGCAVRLVLIAAYSSLLASGEGSSAVFPDAELSIVGLQSRVPPSVGFRS